MKPRRKRRTAGRPRHAASHARRAVLAGAATVALAAAATSPLAVEAADPRRQPTASARAATTTAPTATHPAADTEAAKGTGFALPRQVIAGGGGSSTGGAFAITGTIGQPDADPLQPSTGGVFAISGGFWPAIAPAAPPGDPIFADGFE